MGPQLLGRRYIAWQAGYRRRVTGACAAHINRARDPGGQVIEGRNPLIKGSSSCSRSHVRSKPT